MDPFGGKRPLQAVFYIERDFYPRFNQVKFQYTLYEVYHSGGACFPSHELEEFFSLREFIRQFRSVRVLRVDPFMQEFVHYLQQWQQDDGTAFLPVLEEVELSVLHLFGYSGEEYQRRAAEELAAFEPFVSARERAGRLLKVYHFGKK